MDSNLTESKKLESSHHLDGRSDKDEPQNDSSFITLPPEIHHQISTFLELCDFPSILRTCRALHSLYTSPYIEALAHEITSIQEFLSYNLSSSLINRRRKFTDWQAQTERLLHHLADHGEAWIDRFFFIWQNNKSLERRILLQANVGNLRNVLHAERKWQEMYLTMVLEYLKVALLRWAILAFDPERVLPDSNEEKECLKRLDFVLSRYPPAPMEEDTPHFRYFEPLRTAIMQTLNINCFRRLLQFKSLKLEEFPMLDRPPKLENYSPLHMACKLGRIDFVRFLLKEVGIPGDFPNPINEWGAHCYTETPMTMAMSLPFILPTKEGSTITWTETSQTPEFLAQWEAALEAFISTRIQVIRTLVEDGNADPNFAALRPQFVAQSPHLSTSTPLAMLLSNRKQRFKDPRLRDDSGYFSPEEALLHDNDSELYTPSPFIKYTWIFTERLVELLLELGANPITRSYDDHRRRSAMGWLLEHGLKYSQEDWNGEFSLRIFEKLARAGGWVDLEIARSNPLEHGAAFRQNHRWGEDTWTRIREMVEGNRPVDQDELVASGIHWYV